MAHYPKCIQLDAIQDSLQNGDFFMSAVQAALAVAVSTNLEAQHMALAFAPYIDQQFEQFKTMQQVKREFKTKSKKKAAAFQPAKKNASSPLPEVPKAPPAKAGEQREILDAEFVDL